MSRIWDGKEFGIFEELETVFIVFMQENSYRYIGMYLIIEGNMWAFGIYLGKLEFT